MSALDLAEQLEQEASELLDRVQSLVALVRDDTPGHLHVAFWEGVRDNAQSQIDATLSWSPTEVGDWAIVREVARWQGRNVDDWGQTRSEEWAVEAGPFTHAVMRSVLGQDWIHVVALTRSAASLTAAQRREYRTAWVADYNAHKDEYDDAWRAVLVYDGPGYAALRALWAFVVYAYAFVGPALARRSEVETKHYDVRTRVWRRMFGPIHPDDPAVA